MELGGANVYIVLRSFEKMRDVMRDVYVEHFAPASPARPPSTETRSWFEARVIADRCYFSHSRRYKKRPPTSQKLASWNPNENKVVVSIAKHFVIQANEFVVEVGIFLRA